MENADLNRAQALQEYVFLKDLSACFMQPDLKLAEAVRSRRLVQSFENVLPCEENEKLKLAVESLQAFTESLQGKSQNEVRLILEVEYNRLFVGPRKLLAPPYESYYREDAPEMKSRIVKGPAEAEVREIYRCFGLLMPEDHFELADHIAVELDFLSYLDLQESRAWKDSDEKEADRLHSAFEAFIKLHLKKWFYSFAADVNNGADIMFYPIMVSLVLNTLLAEEPEESK